MAQTFWHVRNCSLFQRLSESQLAVLERRAWTRKFPKGSSVYLPSDMDDRAFLLAAGRVRICAATPDGKQSILAFIEPGELFGELAIVEPAAREERAEAVVDSSVIMLLGEDLRAVMEDSPQLALGVTKLIGLRRKRVERRLRSLLFRSNRERLTHLLLELCEQYGQPSSAGIDLGIKLSHQDLASIIGATRETVTTLLGEMQSEGLLQIRRQRLVVLDLRRLAGPHETMTTALHKLHASSHASSPPVASPKAAPLREA